MNPIKRLRINLGMTQFDLARLLAVSESRISKFETGRSRPNPELLGAMSKAFGVDEKSLLEMIHSPSYISGNKNGVLHER